MIYLFTGSDVGKVRAKAFAWITAARAKAPEASYVRLSPDEITPEALEEVVQSQGLFFTKMLVLLDDPFSSTRTGEVLMDALTELASTDNPIALVAPNLLATRTKKIEAVATKVFTVDVVTKKVPRGFNAGLVNALGARDGKTLWKELIQAQRQGDAPEMLHGLLHWKARDLMVKGSKVWKEEEARALSVSLIELVSRARSGDVPLGLALERFSLGVHK